MKETPKQGTITLTAVGDIMMGDSALCPGYGVGALIKKSGAIPLFEKAAPILKKGDIIFGNLEAVLSNKGMNYQKPYSFLMKAPPEAIKGLQFAGFNVLSLANNHILEHGEEAVAETKSILSEYGIKYIGIDKNVVDPKQFVVSDFKGIKIVFLAYCLIPDKTAYSSTSDPQEICSELKSAKTIADLVVVSLHWGNEYIEKPSPFQIELAHRFIDSGAEVILGHHPHVLQGIELYHHGLIAYSLGNFIFGMNYIQETRDSVILECELSTKGVIDYKLNPLHIDDKYRPVPLEGQRKQRPLARLEQLSSHFEQISESDTQEYEKLVTKLRKSASRRMMLYFLSHIYRYPLPFTVYTIKEYLNK